MVGEYILRYDCGYTGSSGLFGWLGWLCWVYRFVYNLGDRVLDHGEMVMSMAALAQAKPIPRLLSFVEGAWVEARCDYRVVKLFRVEQGPIFHFLAGTGVRVCMSLGDWDRLRITPQYVTVFFVTADLRLLWSFCRVPNVYLRPTEEKVRCPVDGVSLRDEHEFCWRVRWQREAPVVRGMLFRPPRTVMPTFADICAEVGLVGMTGRRLSSSVVAGAYRANDVGVDGLGFEIDLLRVLGRVSEVSRRTYGMAKCFMVVDVAMGLGGDKCRKGKLARLMDKALVVLPAWFEGPVDSFVDVLEGAVVYHAGVSLLIARYTLEDVIDYAEGLAGCVLDEV